MDKQKNFSLAQITSTIISTTLALLSSNKSNAEAINNDYLHTTNMSSIDVKSMSLKKKLVLRLNFKNPKESTSSFHASHSSHSSHSSGSVPSGHASHASHVSSSVSPSYDAPTTIYTPSTHSSSSTLPTIIKPESKIPTNKTHINSSSNSANKIKNSKSNITGKKSNSIIPSGLEKHKLGSRTLELGKSGTDVKELQQLLTDKGYTVRVYGYFDLDTDSRVKAFQKAHNMEPDGKVGPSTLKAIQKA